MLLCAPYDIYETILSSIRNRARISKDPTTNFKSNDFPILLQCQSIARYSFGGHQTNLVIRFKLLENTSEILPSP